MRTFILPSVLLAASVAAAPAARANTQQPPFPTTSSASFPSMAANGPSMMSGTGASAPTGTGDPKALISQSLKKYTENTLAALQHSSGSCSTDKIVKRQSWDDMDDASRTAYLKAVQCMATNPSQSDARTVPGARNRRDDFVYSHIVQTDFIHNSGLLLPWHRQFVWAYEQALRSECGYTGAQPYWDWARFSADQTKSKVWDGSPTSFGGNGRAVPHNASSAPMIGVPGNFVIQRPAGTGGGCVQGGGLGANYSVNLGPVAPAHNAPNNTYGLQYNPRCLSRDFFQPMSTANLSTGAVAELLATPNIHSFRPLLEIKMHPNAHSFAGGDLFDLFSSPNDPVFFLLHAQIDRLWSVWQGQDLAARTDGLDGTTTFLNLPPSSNATLQTVMKMGTAGGDLPISAAMSPTSGQYCYMYV